jgi:hypothetical protein
MQETLSERVPEGKLNLPSDRATTILTQEDRFCVSPINALVEEKGPSADR